MRELNKETILKHYLFAALWTNELDDKNLDDILPSSKTNSLKDIEDFLQKSAEFLPAYDEHFGNTSEEQLGHDFWLSRNGHGAGFFDRYIDGFTEDKLQEIAGNFKERNVFVNELDHILIE